MKCRELWTSRPAATLLYFRELPAPVCGTVFAPACQLCRYVMATPLPDHTAGSPDSPSHAQRELAEAKLELERCRQEVKRLQQPNGDIGDDIQEHFLSTISHEVRTPLSAILLWTSLIEDQKITDPDQLSQGLGAIKQSAEELSRLIEQLVDQSRILGGKLQLELKDVPAVELIHSTLAAVQPLLDEKSIQVVEKFDSSVQVLSVDSRRFQQALGHLITNAAKFTPLNGLVTLQLTRCNGETRLSVADTGQGISAEELPLVLAPGKRKSKARGHSGAGLGLAIARRIAEKHHGRLLVESAGVDRGATFTLIIPEARSTERTGTTDEINSIKGPLSGCRVLLIEDHATTRDELATILKNAGAVLDAVDSAAAAWEAMDRNTPSVIVCDLSLPTIDAGVLMREIRDAETSAGTRRVPAVALTTSGNETGMLKTAKEGFQASIEKPVRAADLVATLAALIG